MPFTNWWVMKRVLSERWDCGCVDREAGDYIRECFFLDEVMKWFPPYLHGVVVFRKFSALKCSIPL